MLEDSQVSAEMPVARRLATFVAAVAIGAVGIGYAVHEHRTAQDLAAQNQQVTAQNQQMSARLKATNSELDALTAKVNALSTSTEAKPPQQAAPAVVAGRRRPAAHRTSAQELRFKKLQSQVDAQGKAIEEARGDLANTRTELSGSIARTHGELVVLEKKGERNYVEFDLQKSRQFKREGPLSVSLRKTNEKHQYADLQLTVDDRDLTQKHVNLYQPVMFYQPDTLQPVELVINNISKDHIHGYISAPKYSKADLADSNSPDQGPNSTAPPARQKLPTPSPEPNQ